MRIRNLDYTNAWSMKDELAFLYSLGLRGRRMALQGYLASAGLRDWGLLDRKKCVATAEAALRGVEMGKVAG